MLAQIKDCRNLEEKVAVLRSTIESSEKDLEVVEQKIACLNDHLTNARK
jgi:hypothetical protein